MINIIGIGPSKENITLAALDALKESDIIVGYKKYIDAVSELIEGKEIIKKGMGDEISRGELAISKSLEGKTVALISSGDPGVFGMANVIFQLVSKYEGIEVKVYPGVSALNYSASLLGAPLHDFAAISLSNLLTPLSEIEKKVEYAAKANLIMAIYNPISKTRKEPFYRFKEIISEVRGENTLIGIVDSMEYPSTAKIVKLADLNEEDINMSCCLIVGNKMTYESEGYMITPRGYVVKSDIHPQSREFFTNYLSGESPCGIDDECEYLPCHKNLEACDFCYCPFYPCGDGSTGGKWIKGKNVWSCEDCDWIHKEKTVKCIRRGIDEILEDVDDLKNKKKALLKLRRECIFEIRD